MKLILSKDVKTHEDINEKLKIDLKIAPLNKTTILIKNKKGLKILYELVSKSFLDYYGNSKPRIPKSLIEKYREYFFISPSPSYGFNESGELIDFYFRGVSKKELEETMKFYDYIQLLPRNCYEKEIGEGEVTDFNSIEEMNKYFYQVAKKLNKLVVAVGNVMYLHDYEYKSKSVLQVANADYRAAKYNSNAYFRTTGQMLDEFKYLGCLLYTSPSPRD